MAFAMPMSAPVRAPRALLVRLLPAVLLCAGALLLTQPWRPASPATPASSFVSSLPTASAASNPSVAPASGAFPGAPALEPAPLIGALLVVGGLLFFLPAVIAKLSPAGNGRGWIGIVEARPLGGRKSLLLVEVEGRRLLIGASEHGFTTLADVSRKEGTFQGALERELAAAPVAGTSIVGLAPAGAPA